MAFDIDIIQIQKDDESVRRYVQRYKDFRLLSLKTSPESFGSTYAREIAFEDDIWYQRLSNPRATTYIAVQDGQILSTVTVVGPLPYSIEKGPAAGNPWEQGRESESERFAHYAFNGMFTLPAARRRGIAQALLVPAVRYGRNAAGKLGKTFVGSIVVDADNPAARSLYAKSGFAPVREEAMGDRRVLVLEYAADKAQRPA